MPNAQDFLGAKLNGARDGVAVGATEKQSLQDQKIEGALQQTEGVVFFLVDIRPKGKLLSGRMSRGEVQKWCWTALLERNEW